MLARTGERMSEIREIKPLKWKSRRIIRDVLNESYDYARNNKIQSIVICMTDKSGVYTDFVITPEGKIDSCIGAIERTKWRILEAWENEQ